MLLWSTGTTRRLSVCVASLIFLSLALQAEESKTTAPGGNKGAASNAANFTVPGPLLRVEVRRGTQTLPIYEVPSLQAGDVLSVTSSFKEKEPVHWLLISGFLRGATEPPPEQWFNEVELWKHHNWDHPHSFTVPAGARQGLIFLAPDSGGGFSTLKNTVRRQPNLFLRVSQDMTKATAEQGRLDSFLAGMRSANPTGTPQTAGQRSIALANSLSINVNGKCFDANQQQTPCLVQNTDQMLANSGNRTSAINNLTSMPSAGLIGSVVSTQIGAAFFPYVGAAIDVVHLLGGARTADYQYLPALAKVHGDRIQLELNHDPIFKNPKSVLVYVLPQVQTDTPPQINVDTENHPTCLGGGAVALPAEAPPSLYSTRYGHDWTLSLKDADGRKQTGIGVQPDPTAGGFVVPAGAVDRGQFGHDTAVTGEITGHWGFKSVSLPSFILQHPRSGAWQLDPKQQENLIAGGKVVLNLNGPVAACIDQVQLRDSKGHRITASLSHLSATSVAASLDLSQAVAGDGTLAVHQSGLNAADQEKLRIYQPLPTIHQVTYYADDHEIQLQGEGLDEIASMEIAGEKFQSSHPAASKAEANKEELAQPASEPVPVVNADSDATAILHLRDGRTMNLPFHVQAPRPVVKMLGIEPRIPASTILLKNQNAVPQDAQLNLTLQSITPSSFQPDEKIQVRGELQTEPVELKLSQGLMLQDQHTVIASFVPAQLLGSSAFGKIEYRVVDARGVAGPWQSLPKVVRLPQLKEIRCPLSLNSDCTLVGDHLYLLTAIAADPAMKREVKIPVGFTGASIQIPRPNGSTIFVKLRDDPDAADPVLLPVMPEMGAGSGEP